MLEEIIKQKINNKYYSQLEIARIIYIELGKLLSFNTDYLNNLTKSQYNDIVNLSNFNKNQVICRIWSQLYCSLLKKYGIKAKICSFGHAFVEFYINDEAWIADATYGSYTDFSRIKHGDYTTHFGKGLLKQNNKTPTINEATSNPIIEEIDKKIGYIEEINKLNRFKEHLISIKNNNINISKLTNISYKTNDELIILKIDYLFKKLGNMCNGFYEAKDFVYEIEKYILDDNELKQVKGTQLIRINKNKHTDIVQCISAKLSDGSYIYYLLIPNYPIKKVTVRDLMRLSILGYGIGDKSIPGMIYPTKFIETAKSKQGNIFRKIKLFKECPYLKVYDEFQHSSIHK